MSNELTDVRCPCGAEFQADSYDAGFIAGSGMCQNCDAALPPKDICTCPSGDGSLRHPCPVHPASVELAGVAAKLTFINGRPAMCGCQVEYSSGGGEYSDVIYVTLCAKHSGSAILDLVATNRIALTPEYEGQWHADLYLDREIPLAKAEGATPAEAVLALMSAERIDPEQESVEQAGGDERAAFELFVRKHCGMPEHIAVNWDAKFTNDAWEGWKARAALAQPSPAQAEQAEAERPEVVARVVHSNPVVLGQCGPLNANDELMTVAQHAASVARWAEMFNRVEQERDAALAEVERLTRDRDDCLKARLHYATQLGEALARVAELERQEPVALANRGLHAFWVKWTEAAAGLYGPGIKLYAAPVVQAQHSVPKEFIGRLSEFLAQRGATGKALLRELRDMLATAPGKEGM
ncbi:hypothetical protein [Pseudomonas aeruginosa]|uniref:hypothetical protein n=1 Tax=Pseudomonas aeruginosa TaxID=287 RepID=UPI0034D1D590